MSKKPSEDQDWTPSTRVFSDFSEPDIIITLSSYRLSG